jgi:hypothetical protein
MFTKMALPSGVSPAGDFAALGAHQEALERVGRGRLAHGRDDVQLAAIGLGVAQRLLAAVAHLAGHGGQHHAVGNVGVGAVIGLDPADAGGLAEHQAVRAGEVLVGGQCGQVDQRLVGTGFGAKQVHVPGKGWRPKSLPSFRRTRWPLGLPCCLLVPFMSV